MMKKLLYALLGIITLASCTSSYNIQGSSNVSTLDGRMLYLKVLSNNDFKKIDSCDVIPVSYTHLTLPTMLLV